MALPVVDPAREGDDVLVAELFERLGRERRPVARRAVGDDRPRAVRSGLLDPGLQPPARNVDGAGDVALVPLLALTDIQKNGGVRVLVQLPGALGADLVDLLPGLVKEFPIRAHCFPIYSDCPLAMVGTWTRVRGPICSSLWPLSARRASSSPPWRLRGRPRPGRRPLTRRRRRRRPAVLQLSLSTSAFALTRRPLRCAARTGSMQPESGAWPAGSSPATARC